MMLMYPERRAEEGALPTQEEIAGMMKFNEELANAGVLLSLDGLHPTSKGARVRFSTGKPVVTDGPFAESKELLGGFWMIRVNSREEAIDWASRCPIAGTDAFIEVRQVFEAEDFGPNLTPELKEREERIAAGL